jgi:anaerobic magnesium-protoporphyrin IX monomethyl ester cyclase
MKVLLVNPQPKRFFKSLTCPLGILSIATYLIERDHSVKIIDRDVEKNYRKIISEFNPDIIGISVISNKAIEDAVKFSKIAHTHNIPVVWGGALASIIPETVLESGCVDYVIIGEGEITWEMLLETLDNDMPLNAVNGLAYTESGEIIINKDRVFADLADLPIIDWSLINPSDYFQSLFTAKKMLYLYSAKGCPEQCTFCFNKGFNKCTYRKRPFEYCLEEIKYLVENTEIDGVHFADELWCRNKKEMAENCGELINAGLRIFWGCNARIGVYAKEDFEYMFRAGCRWMFFGVESGSETIQKEIKKRIPLDMVEETVKNCTDAGIAAITSFIIGFPDETEEDIKMTISLAKKIPGAMYDFNFYFPIPGSEMCDKLIEEGRYALPKTLEEYAEILPTEKVQINFSKIPSKELRVIRAYFMWSSFSRKNTTSDTKRYAFTKKAITDAVKGLFGHGIKNFIITFLFGAEMFFTIVSSLLFHPKIRKKYGL